MRAALRITIATPASIVISCEDVRSLRAADASGGFGIQPGHADFLTVLPASVVQWRTGEGAGEGKGAWHYCALRAGVLQVTGGNSVAIACRQAVLGSDLATLESEVRKVRAEEADADRDARVEQVRIHTMALRQIVRRLMPGASAMGLADRDMEPGP